MTDFHAQAGRTLPADVEATGAQVAADEVDLAEGLQGLAAMVAAAQALDDSLAEVAGFAEKAIPGVDGAGVTLIGAVGTSMKVQAWAVTAPFVREIDIVQYEVLQEGPCITCMQQGVAQISGSLAGDARWTRFGGRVGRLGVSSALALPLLVSGQVVGSLNCYAYDSDVFGEHAVRLGTAFAGPAAVAVFNAQVLAATRSSADQLQRALVSRTVIDQAIGILRARSGGTVDEAFGRLRHLSSTENTKLHEVARRIVDDAVRRAESRYRSTPPTT